MNIWQWQEKTHVIADFPNGAQIRLTIGACSGYESGVYGAFMQEARNYVKEIYGVDSSDFLDNATPEQLVEWSCYYQRSIMLSCLLAVESRQDESSEWKPDELPDEWRSIHTFAKAVPFRLFNDWLRTCYELNPGVFNSTDDDGKKKYVRSNVVRLMN